VYVHAPTNEDYFAIFLHGWLTKCNGFPINWAQYAYDNTQEQMKRTKRPSFSSKGNYNTTSNLSQFEGGLEFNDNEDCIMLERPRKLTVFLWNPVAVMKELLEEVKVSEQSTRPRRFTLQSKKEKLDNETIKLSSNLHNKKRQLEEEESSFIEMEAKLVKK
jgi:hypothetical protein